MSNDINITDEVSESYMEYALSTIISRALPDIRDGLKPVQRRIIYAMKEAGLYSKSQFVKSVSIIGDTLKKYHPHGDAAVYGALANMTQTFNSRYPLIQGQGNFGSVNGAPPAAARYTEAKLSIYSDFCVEDIEKKGINFNDNFDGRYQEPEVLPVSFPVLLCNGGSGIAVGMATKIPPHNISEALDASIQLIKNPDISIERLMKYIKGPDFPTGGYVLGIQNIKEALKTGKGSVTMQAKTHTEKRDDDGGINIVITELPYQVKPDDIEEKIIKMSQDNEDFFDIQDVKNLSDNKRGLNIVVELKLNSKPEVILEKLFQNTDLRSNFSYNMRVIDGGIPKLVGIKSILKSFVEFFTKTNVNLIQEELKNLKDELHTYEGFQSILKDISNVVDILEKSKNKNDAKNKLKSKYKLSEQQVEKILAMPLSRITQLEKKSIDDKINFFQKEMNEKRNIIANKDNIDKYIIDKLKEIKKHIGDERRTEIIEKAPEKIDISDLLSKQEVVIIYTRDGYIKRSPLSDYKVFKTKNSKGTLTLTSKEEDSIDFFDIASLNQDVLFFTESCKMYYKSVHKIPEFNRKSRGVDIGSLLGIDEKVSYLLPLDKNEDKKYLIFITKQGYIKKTAIEEYNIEDKRRGLLGMRLKENDEIVDIFKANDEDEILIINNNGFVNRFQISNVNDTGRKTQGVQGINISQKEHVISSHIVSKNKGLYLLTATEMGKIKKTMLSEYTTYSGRVNKGLIGVKIKDNDILVDTTVASNKDDILLITSDGKTLRYNCSEINHTGRNTQGINLIKLDKNSKVIGINNVVNEEYQK